MPNESDFTSGAAGDPGAVDQPLGLSSTVTGDTKLLGEQEIVNNLSQMQMRSMNALGAQLGVQSAQNAQPPMQGKLSIDLATGNVDAKGMPKDFVEGLMRDRQELAQIRGSFAQEAMRLRSQENRVRGNPVMQLATALASNLAQDPNLPGWVQGAGRTAAALNPTADELRNRRLALLEKQAQLSGREVQGAESMARIGQERERIDLERRRMENLSSERQTNNLEQLQNKANERAAKFGAVPDKTEFFSEAIRLGAPVEQIEKRWKDVEAAAAEGKDKLRQGRIKEAYGEIDKAISAGAGRFDAKAATESLTEAGANPAELRTNLRQLEMHASNVREKFTAEQAARTQKVTEKESGDKALEAAAQSLAKGDLSAIRDISSFRGQDRMKLYARVKELDPNFTVADLNRKIKTMDSFFSANGPDAKQLQSLGTFLQHSGEVVDATKSLKLFAAPYANKPLNWWRKNMSGSPEYQKLVTAIEPVAKEYESFLLGGRALYRDDRERVDAILNSNLGLDQLLAASRQMGKTVKDRYTEMNHKFKRQMKKDLAEVDQPLSDEALAGAAKIGIDLGIKPAGEPPSGGTKRLVFNPATGMVEEQ